MHAPIYVCVSIRLSVLATVREIPAASYVLVRTLADLKFVRKGYARIYVVLHVS